MPEFSAGEAKLAIVPDISGFQRKLEADLKKIDAELAIRVAADTAQARTDITRFRDLERAKGIQIGVETSLSEASAEMAAWRARQEANRVKVRVDADTGGALQKLEELDSAFSSILGSIGGGLKINLIWAGIGELPAVTLALTQAVGAVQQLAQAGLVLPGVFAGAGASFATLALGLNGVKEAYDAVSKAAKPTLSEQAQNAREVTAATNAHRNAVQDEAQAERDRTQAVKDARYALEDLNLQLRGGKISEEQAVNNALRQRRDLQRDLAKGQIKDQLDLQQRLLDIQEADQGVAEAHQRNIELQDKAADANQKGIANSDKVIAANERVTRSQQAVAQSADALSEAVGKPGQAVADAMANLSPNMQAVVKELAAMQGQFQAFQNSVQDSLSAGLSGSIKRLVDSDLPVLQKGIGGIATAWNGTLKQLFTSLGSDSSKGLLDRILGDTAKAQDEFTKAIDPLVQGIGTLTAASADALPRLADDLKSVADRFNSFITGADQDGSLSRWINDGITGFEHLGNTMLNIGKAIGAVTRAAGGGEGLLGLLEQGSKKLAEFLNSTEGQNKLKQWFEEGRREIQDHIIPLLKDLPGLFTGIVNAGQQIADVVVPPLKDIGTYLSNHKQLVKDVIDAFVLWKGVSFAGSIIGQINKISDALGSPGTKSGGKGGKGGKLRGGAGLLGKMALLTGGAILLDDALTPDDDSDAKPPTAGDTGGNVAGNATSGAIFGGSVAGVPGALIGTGAGAIKGLYDSAKQDVNAAKQQDLKDSQKPGANSNYVQHPLLYNPDGSLKPAAGEELRAKIAAGQLYGYSLAPDGTIIGPDGKPVDLGAAPRGPRQLGPLPAPTNQLGPDDLGGLLHYFTGGATPTNPGPLPDGGYHAVVHPREFVQSERAVDKYGAPFMNALNSLSIDPKTLPHYDQGWMVGPDGNPVTPGMLPGPSDPSVYQPIAPNPMAGDGVTSAFSAFVSGLSPAIQNLTGVATGQQQGGQSGSGGSGFVPGLLGLPGVMDWDAKQGGHLGMDSWMQASGDYLAKWGAKTISQLGGGLYKGVLDFFGLGNSILSPSNSWFQAGAQSLGVFDKLAPAFGWSNGAMPQVQMQDLVLPTGEHILAPAFLSSNVAGAPVAAPGAGGAGIAVPAGKGAEAWRGTVAATVSKYAAAMGIPQAAIPAWVNAITSQIDFESKGNPNADNPNDTNGRGGTQHVAGLLQYLPSSYAASGGKLTGLPYLDPVGQIAGALFAPRTASGFPDTSATGGIGANHGWGPVGYTPHFADGGLLSGPGTGTSDSILAKVSTGEFVSRASSVDKYGAPFYHALNEGRINPAMLPGFALGDLVQPWMALTNPQPKPTPANQQLPDVQHITAPPRASAVIPSAPTTQLPQPIAAPPVTAVTPPDQTQQQDEAHRVTPAPVIGSAPTDLNHNLSAINTGIKSGAALAGNLASSAISAGGGAAGMGIGSMGAGELGQFVNGLIQEGGKTLTQAVNIGSSLLVGNVPGSGSTTARAFGETLIPQRAYPDVPTDSRGTYNFYGHDTASVMQQLEIKQAQESQARLAKYGG